MCWSMSPLYVATGSMSMFSSSRRSCKASYLLLILSRNVSVTSLSFRTSTLYLVLMLLFISLSSSASSSFYPAKDGGLRLFLNFCPIQIWSIWFSVLWSGDIQVDFFIIIMEIHYLRLSVY